MKKLLLLFLLINQFSYTQEIIDFEEFVLSPESYIKDAGPSGGFTSGKVFLPNSYTDAGSFDYWSGWVISNLTDTLTQGFTNEASSYAASGNNGSENFAVCYAAFPTQLIIEPPTEDTYIDHLYVCNSSYTALSMKFGDSIAKKFGGLSGNDPDSLILTIKAWKDGSLSLDSVNVILADYRFEDNNLDYIQKDWIKVELLSLGLVDSLQFKMSSSDNGAFGMNTPAYFCIDDIQLSKLSNINEEIASVSTVRLYPNPTVNTINLEASNAQLYTIYSETGQVVQKGNCESNRIDVSELHPGKYWIIFPGTPNKPTQFYKF